MKDFKDMSDVQLEELLQGCFRYMASLTVNSRVPAEDRKEYQQYQSSVEVIESEQNRRQGTTVAMQDTTGYVW